MPLAPPKRVIEDGVVFLPGSRKHEIANLVPFFATVAMRLRAIDGEIPISFGISPFTEIDALDRALRAPDIRTYAMPARIVETRDGPAIAVDGAPAPFPIVRDALQTAVRSRVAVTIPGTKCIELAALGVPTVACIPFNMPEKVVINGALTYLDRLPGIGTPLKRAVVLAYAGSFRFFTQPNIDAGTEIMPEIAGTITPGRIARAAYELAQDAPRRAVMSEALRALYVDHAGATERMSDSLLTVIGT